MSVESTVGAANTTERLQINAELPSHAIPGTTVVPGSTELFLPKVQ